MFPDPWRSSIYNEGEFYVFNFAYSICLAGEVVRLDDRGQFGADKKIEQAGVSHTLYRLDLIINKTNKLFLLGILVIILSLSQCHIPTVSIKALVKT